MKKILLLGTAVLFAFLFFVPTADAAVRTSTATGGNWTTGSTWIGGVAPTNTDSAIIATTGGNSVTIGANVTNAGLTVNSGAILNINGTAIITENGNVVVNGDVNGRTATIRMNTTGRTIDGSGTINSIILAAQNFSFLSSANLTINNNINSSGRTVTNNGIVYLNGNYARTGGTAVWTQGTNAVVNISGMFTPAANVTVNAAAAGNIVNYNGAAQSLEPTTYVNLTLSGSGAKTFITGTTAVSGKISIQGTATTILTGTFTPGTASTLEYKGSATQTTGNEFISPWPGSGGVLIENANGVTLNTAKSVGARPFTIGATVANSIFNDGGFQLTGTGVLNLTSGTFVLGSPSSATVFPSFTTRNIAVGTTVEYVAGVAQTVAALTYSNLTINKSAGGATLSGAGTRVDGTLTLTSGVLATGSNDIYISGTGSVARTSGHIIGNLRKYISTGATSKTFEIGDSLNYTPVTITFGNVTIGGDLTFSTTAGDHPNIATSNIDATKSVNRYWTATSSGITFDNYSANITFTNPGDLDSGVNTGDLIVGQYAGGVWSYPTVGTRTSVSTVATGITGFGAFQLGTPKPITPTKFVILPPTNGTVDAPIVVTIEAQNNAGAVATTYQQDVTLLKSGSATGGGLVNIINGVGTTTISDTVAETVHLSLSDTQSTGLDVSSTQDVIFAPGATSQLLLSGVSSVIAGTRGAFSVVRKDQYNNLKTVGSETFYLYSDSVGTAKRFYDAASGGNIITSITVQNGTSSADFWYYDELAGSATITASDNAVAPDGAAGISDGTSAVTITPAAAAQFSLTNQTSMVAGTRLDYSVTRKDQFGNLSTVGTSTAYLYSSSLGSAKKFFDSAMGSTTITSIAILPGSSSAQFWYYDELAGSATVTASDNAVAPDGNTGIIDGTNVIVITPASTGKFILNNPGNMTAGTRLGYTVTRQDIFGNAVTVGSDTAHLYSNSTGATKAFYDASTGGNLITSITIANGLSSAQFWYYDEQVGTWTVTASDNAVAPDGATGIIDATQALTVNAAPIIATRIVILKPTDDVVGSTIPVTVQAQDDAGNLDTTYNNSTDITLKTSGSATPQNGVILTIVNGVATVNITDTKAETVTLSLTATASTTLDVSSTQTVTFTTGPTAQFTLNNPGNMTAGTRLGYTVTRKDSFGNLVTAGTDTIHLYSNSTGGLGAFYSAASGGVLITSVQISDGNSATQFWYSEGKAGTWTVTASDNAVAPDGAAGIADASQSVTVSPAATSQFLIDDPGNMTAGTRLGYTVTRKDSFGNLVTAGSNTFYMYSNSTAGAFYSAASGGSLITSRTIVDGASTASFWYYDSAVGTWTVTASDNAMAPDGAAGIADASRAVTVSSAPIVATQFTIIKPSDVLVGTNTTVTIRAEDNNGNLDTTYNNNVTLVVSGSAVGGGVVTITNGVGTKTITDAVAETVTLSLLDTAGTTLDVSSTQTVTFSSTPVITVSAGGQPALVRSTVIFSGTAFPDAKLTILGVSNGNIPVRRGATARADGSFSIRFSDLTPGIQQYFLSAIDESGRPTQTKVYPINVNQSLIVRDVFLPPTLGFTQQAVLKGGFLGITGFASPGNTVEASIDGKPIPNIVVASNSGEYKITFNTLDLQLGTHTVRVWQSNSSGERSDSSIERTFLVTNLFVPQTDLNGDGAVNASDLSIFLARWLSKDSTTRKSLDFNGDGVIDIQDLSIFARTLNK